MTEHATKALLAAIAGGLIGWTANALTLVGRVDALEKGVQRIEQLIIDQQKGARNGNQTEEAHASS